MSAFGSSPLTSSLTGSDGEDEIGLSPPVPTSSILSSTPTRVVAGVTSTRKRKRVIDSDGSFNESTRTLQNATLHSKHDRSTKLKDLEDRSDKLIDDEDSIDELALTDNQFADSPRVRRRGCPSSVSNSSRSTDRQETAFSRREKERTNHPETPTRRLYKYRERVPSIPSPESEEMTLDTSRIQIPHISHDYHGLAGLLPIRRREHSIIDLTTPSPPNSNTDLIDEPPASQGESIFSDTPLYDDLNSREAPQREDIDSTLEARGPPSTIQEDVSPSASKVVDLIEFESFFTNPKPELKESVEEIAYPSTDKRAHSAEKSPEMLLSSKEAVTYDNSSIALRMRKFVDGVRATQQGLVKWWLGGPNQSSGSPEEISRPRSPSAGAAFADDNLFLDTPSRAGSELSTTLVHGEVGAPRVNLIAWSSVMNESPTSSASVGIHLQQRSVPSPFSLENVHFSTPPNAVGKSGSVKLIRRRSGVVVPPLGQLSTADNDSTFFAQLKSSKELVEQEIYPSQDLDSQLSTQIVTSRPSPVESPQKFLSERPTRSPSSSEKRIYYTPTRHFSHVEVTGMPHYRITTKGGLKITPLPGFDPKKNGVRKDDSEDDLYFKSPTPKSHFNIHRTLQTNSRKKSSSGPGLYQPYDESISGWQSGSASEDNENYDDDSGDSDEYLYEDAVPRSQIQGHKRRRLNSPLPGFFKPFSVRVSDNSTGLTPSLARTSLKVRDQYPFGQCVDEINITNVVIQPVKHGSSGTLCHNCRSGNGNRSLRARCQHRVSAATVSDPDAFVRCNKSYCERCLRFWYGMDDDAMNFILYGNRNSEGRIGTGLGMGIIEGTWLCPWCINLCMCTFCQRKRGESRTRFRPSLRAKIAQPPPSPRRKLPKLRLNISSRPQFAPTPAEIMARHFGSSPGAGGHELQNQKRRRRLLEDTPSHWFPSIPSSAVNCDPESSLQTRPCTRDWPTGAPPPSAANHAPIMYRLGASLEDDGVEDLFTGSENDDSNRATPKSNKGSSTSRRKRRNYQVVAPGSRLPSTTKLKFPRNQLPSPLALSESHAESLPLEGIPEWNVPVDPHPVIQSTPLGSEFSGAFADQEAPFLPISPSLLEIDPSELGSFFSTNIQATSSIPQAHDSSLEGAEPNLHKALDAAQDNIDSHILGIHHASADQREAVVDDDFGTPRNRKPTGLPMHNDQGNSFPPFELLLPTIHDGHSSDLSSFSKATPPMRPHDMPDESFASPFRAFPKPKQKKFDTSLLSPPLKDAFLWSDNALLGRETPRLGSPVGQTPGIPLDPIDLLEGPADGSRFLHPPLSTEGDILFG